MLWKISILTRYQDSLWKCKNPGMMRDLQDGRGVRRGDHLPLHKYIRNTSICGTILQNTYWTLAEDLRLPKRQETPPRTWVGQKKEEKERQKNRDRTYTSGRELWRTKSFHTLGSPSLVETGGGGGGGGSFRATEESAAIGVQRAKWRDSHTEDQCWPALTSLRGLSTHPPGQVGAGNWGLGFRVQIPGRGLGLAAWTQPEGG